MNDDECPGLRFAREAVCKSTTQGEYDWNARLLGELLHPLTPEMRDAYESNPGLRFARVAVLKSTEEGEYATHARVFQDLLQTRVQSQPEQGNTSSPGAVNDETAAVPTKKWCSKGENCVHEGGPEQPLANFGKDMGRIRGYCRSCRNEVQKHYRSSAAGATRFIWTAELHAQFVTVMNEIENMLGPGRVTTGSILERMEIPGLTYAHVNSHLQKYRQKQLVDQRQNGEAPLGDEDEVEMEGYAGGDQAEVDALAAESEQTTAVEVALQQLTTRPHPTLPGSPCDPSHKKCAKCGQYERHRFRKGTRKKENQCVRCDSAYQKAYREKRRKNKELQAEVGALAAEFMEAAEQRKKDKEVQAVEYITEAAELGIRRSERIAISDARDSENFVAAQQTLQAFGIDPEISNPKRKNGTGCVYMEKSSSSSGRVRWVAKMGQKYLGTYDTKEEAGNACDRYSEDPDGFVNHRLSLANKKSVELCGDCKTQVENLKRSNDPLDTFELFKPCPTCLSAAISICPPCEADIHGDGRNRDNDGHGKVNYPMLKNKTPKLQIQRHRAADGKLMCKQCWKKTWKTWKFTARYKGKHIGTFDTGTQAYSAIDAIDAIPAQGGTGKTNPATSSTSGLEDLAMLAALEQPESSKRPRSDDEEDVEKFTGFEIGHLVFARSGKANWAPAQISAISTSAKGHQVYDVEFFVKENGVYPRAQNLPLSKLEPADEDTFEKHSGRRKKSKNWVEGMEEFRRVYDKSRRV